MKYVLKTKKVVGDITLYQVKAVKDFGAIKKGDLGGWIEKESNLSQKGNAWVSGDAWVYGDARVNVTLCNRFNFKNTDEIKLWVKKEEEFQEESKKIV